MEKKRKGKKVDASARAEAKDEYDQYIKQELKSGQTFDMMSKGRRDGKSLSEAAGVEPLSEVVRLFQQEGFVVPHDTSASASSSASSG